MTGISLTCTGVDETTDPKEVLEFIKFYPKLELGILVGSKSKPEELGSNPRFPSLKTVAAWKDLSQQHHFKLAIHLCGKHSRAVNDGSLDHDVLGICEGAHRVQVNAVRYNYDNIRSFADLVDAAAVIVQHRTNFGQLPMRINSRIQYLFDRSGGRGQDHISMFPYPNRAVRCGYAGGIKYENIERVLAYLYPLADQQPWIDCESGVRTSDRFDLGKVFRLCEKVFGYRRNQVY